MQKFRRVPHVRFREDGVNDKVPERRASESDYGKEESATAQKKTHPLSVTTGPAFILPIRKVGFSHPIFCRSDQKGTTRVSDRFRCDANPESQIRKLTLENFCPRKRSDLDRNSLFPIRPEYFRVFARIGDNDEVSRGFCKDLFP